MTTMTCAICNGEDRLATGICPSCSVTDRDWALLFVRPSRDERARTEAASSLRNWVQDQRDLRTIEETVRGERVLAVLPAALGGPAARRFAGDGVNVRVLSNTQWYRALPASFGLMIFAIAIVGALAGFNASPFLLFATPAMIALLIVGAWLHMRAPLVRFPRTQAVLPAPARAELTRALSTLPAGRARELLLDLARVAEHTYAGLPTAFRSHDLGAAVIDLVTEAGPLAVESARLSVVADELDDDTNASNASQIRQAADQRITLLHQTLTLLGRIAREGAESKETVAAEVSLLLGRVRTEQHYRSEAEAAVQRALDPRNAG